MTDTPQILEGDAAIERARQTWGVIELVWRDERGQEVARSGPLHAGTCKVGIPLDAQHVDVVAGEPGQAAAEQSLSREQGSA